MSYKLGNLAKDKKMKTLIRNRCRELFIVSIPAKSDLKSIMLLLRLHFMKFYITVKYYRSEILNFSSQKILDSIFKL